MAIIKSMKLKGFKSFAKPLELEFGTGFNCIIGPNGSGKSNVMDALCFVLGKLSAKSMRAEKSSNLIYNGGKTGTPLKEAEVSIIFSNDNNEFPIESEEVKLTRVIKTTGNSVYKINDEVLTRQQILELLAHAKIDPDGHNIILQGDIVRFMEMKADNRRELIEDIAGISIFEDKKNKAMNSLNRAEGQLNDATIILKERETYLKELKKDKDQAEKYKNLEKNINANKATYLHIQIKDKKEKVEEIEKRIKKQQESITRIEEQTTETRKKIAEKKQELIAINKDIEEKGEKEAVSLQDDIEQLKTDVARNEERLTTCKNEVEKVQERKKQLQTSLDDTKKTIRELEESKQTLTAEIKQLKEKEIKASTAITSVKGKLGLTDNTELDTIETALDNEVKTYQELQEKNQDILQKKFKLDADISTIQEKITAVEQLEKDTNIGRIQKDFERIDKDLKKRINEDETLFAQLKRAKEEYAKHNEQLFRAQTQQSSMKASASADFAIKKIKSLRNPQVFGTVSELGEVEKKFSVALEVAAGPRIRSLVVKDDKVAAECIRTLKTAKVGIATFLPMNKIRPRQTTRIKGKGVYGSAMDLISFDPRYKDIFSYVFANTLVVENIEIARRVGISKARMVTLEGDIVEMSGAMVGGYRTKRVGMGFQEKNVNTNIEKLSDKIDELTKVKDVLEQRKTENEDTIASLRNEKSEVEASIVKYERTSSGVSLHELQQQHKAMKNDPIYSTFTNVGKEMERVNKQVQRLRSERDQIRKKTGMQGNNSELETLESRRLKVREEIVEKNTEVKNIDIQTTNMYRPEVEKIQLLVKSCDKEREDFSAEFTTLNSLIKDQRSILGKKDGEKSRFQKAYKGLFTTRNKVSESIQKLENTILLDATREKTIQDRVNELSINRAKVVAEVEGLNTEFEEYKGTTLRRGLTVEDLKVEIKNFEQMLAKIGNVNMRALEVYEELHKEYEVLVKKKVKLEDERNDVLDMIVEIEKNKKSIFMKTYKELNKNFSRIFLSLSKKGDATLELEDKENPLDGGIDIRVRIGGNRFLDIKSLSGGEKTMAALAFIFAIQEYQPMAFYLLDEVDAALDKKNSELLSELVSKYSGTAQYIMISHNDNVISEADYVYGVSMHQTGMSKVVSLKL